MVGRENKSIFCKNILILILLILVFFSQVNLLKTPCSSNLYVEEKWTSVNEDNQESVTKNVALIRTNNKGDMVWNRTYGGDHADELESVIQTTDGGFALVGKITVKRFADYHTFFIKTDGLGIAKWSEIYEKETFDTGKEVIQTEDNGYVILSEASLGKAWTTNLDRDIRLLKIDKTGTEEWDYCFTRYGTDHARTFIQTSDGGYVIIGEAQTVYSSTSFFTVDQDIFIIKVDENGTEEWRKVYDSVYWNSTYSEQTWNFENGFPENDWDHPESIVEIDDKCYMIIGKSRFDWWTVKINKSGEVQTNQTIFRCNDQVGIDKVIQTKDDSLLLIGTKKDKNLDNWSTLLIKMNNKGEQEWNKTYSSTNYAYRISSIVEKNDGGFILLGSVYSNIDINLEERYLFWLCETHNNGNIQWNQILHINWVSYKERLIVLCSDNSIVLGGTFSRRGVFYGHDLNLLKFNTFDEKNTSATKTTITTNGISSSLITSTTSATKTTISTNGNSSSLITSERTPVMGIIWILFTVYVLVFVLKKHKEKKD